MNATVIVVAVIAAGLLATIVHPPRFDPLRPGWREPRRRRVGSRHPNGSAALTSRLVAVVLTLGAVTATAAAQEPRLQADVFGRVTEPDDFGWGLMLSRGPDTGTRLEFFLEQWREDDFVWRYEEGPFLGRYSAGGADLYSLQLGMGRYWAGPTFFPFLAASAGVVIAQPDIGPVTSKGYATASIGGGFEVKLSERWHFRLDGRGQWIGWEADESGWDCGWSGGGPCDWQGGEYGFGGATVDTVTLVLRVGIGARW